MPGDYRILKKLGSGAFGTTHLVARLEKDGERFAMKELDVGDLRDWKALELFEREGKVLAELDHPGIPKTLDVFHEGEGGNARFYLVQTLAPGKSLAERVKDGFRPNEQQAENIAREVLAVLAYLHGREPPIIHRDVKPENLVIDGDSKVCLVDFGCVQSGLSESIAVTGTVAGTFGYMAPEQLRGRAVAASDLFGLGCTLVFLLSGKSPADFPHPKNRIDLSSLDVSPHFRAWLQKMTAPPVEDRFVSAKEALTALAQRAAPSRSHATTAIFVFAGVLIAGVAIQISSFKGPAERAVPPATNLPPPSSSATAARPPRSLIATWSFNDTCKQAAPDLKAGIQDFVGGHHLRPSGSVECVPGGMKFHNGGFFEAKDAPDLHLKNALTIVARVKPSRTSGNGTIVNKWYAPDMYMLLLTDRHWRFSVATEARGQTHDVETAATANVWAHVAGVYDGKAIRLFLDGKRVAEGPAPGPLQDSDRPIAIGSHPTWNAYEGLIDDIRLFDIPLEDDEIASLAREK